MMDVPKIDISPANWEIVKGILQEHVPAREVWAFGSRAKWTAKEYSDLDLAILGEEPLGIAVQAALSNAFSESDLPFKVDVVDWATTSESFRKVIQAQRVVVQKPAHSASILSSEQLGRRTGVASEWQLREVSELIDEGTIFIGDGYRAKNLELGSSGLPFARAGNINNGFRFDDADLYPEDRLDRVGNKISQPGDVVFTSKGTVGRFAFVRPGTPRFVYSPQLCFWRSLDRRVIEPRFLFYWMFGREFFVQFKGVAGQTDMAEYVSLADQRRMQITLPPPDEQRAIAHILGTLDDRIELNRRMSETLEAMARALFKSWFVDFDPVRAKAEGRDPGLPDEIASLFPAALTENPDLGEIPEGWSIGPILDRARLLSGGTPKTARPDYWGGQIAWASAKDVSQSSGSFLVDTERAITERGLNESATQIVPALSSVVVARGATTGRMVLLGCDMAMNQTCYALTTTTETPFALYCQLRNEIGALVHAAHGSVFDTITTRTIASSRVVLPPELVLRTFEDQVAPLLRRVLVCTRESRFLTALRDALLPKLISGDLRLDDPERILERVG